MAEVSTEGRRAQRRLREARGGREVSQEAIEAKCEEVRAVVRRRKQEVDGAFPLTSINDFTGWLKMKVFTAWRVLTVLGHIGRQVAHWLPTVLSYPPLSFPLHERLQLPCAIPNL